MHFVVITLIIAAPLSNASNARIEAMIVEQVVREMIVVWFVRAIIVMRLARAMIVVQFVKAMANANVRLRVGDVTDKSKI
jgi:hypothetical protein